MSVPDLAPDDDDEVLLLLMYVYFGFSVTSFEIPSKWIPLHTFTCMFFKAAIRFITFFVVVVFDVVGALCSVYIIPFLSILAHPSSNPMLRHSMLASD